MRIGHGYDVHRLVPGRKLILGGVEIPCEKGLLGHSDADVLAHAIMDALLGAAALGDIGKLFPDNDPVYEGADSLVLLQRVTEVLMENGYAVGNVDATVLAQRPKLAPHIPAVRERLAQAMGISTDQVSGGGECRPRRGAHRKTVNHSFTSAPLKAYDGLRGAFLRPFLGQIRRYGKGMVSPWFII